MPKSSIQFFGLPGSGKTTVIKGLFQAFPEIYAPVPSFSKIKRYFLAVLFSVYFPAIALNFLRLIMSNNYKLWGYLLHLTSLAFAAHMYTFLQRKKTGKIFLIDEGLLQRSLSVAPGKLSERKAKKLIALLAKVASAAVIVRGGAFDRFVHEPDRMMSARNKFGEAYFKKWAENLSYNLNTLTAVLAEKESFVEIDNTERKSLAGALQKLHQTLSFSA